VGIGFGAEVAVTGEVTPPPLNGLWYWSVVGHPSLSSDQTRFL
jgi:hypothetical protein